MKKNNFLYVSLIFVVFLNVFLSTWSVRHNDLNLHADVARDFLLLDELDAKKIVFIGPRSGTSGVFHGPLWSYLNYPAYLFGHGDPVIVGWFWILLTIIFFGSSFLMAQKLLGSKVAVIYTLLLSGNMIFHTNALSHSHGALFLTPSYLFTMLLYMRFKRWWLLALHFIIGSLIIQFQIAAGIPFVLISFVLTLYLIKKNKKRQHLLVLLVIPLVLINFILFDVKYDFKMFKASLKYSSPQTNAGIFDYSSVLLDRLDKSMDLQLSPGLSNKMAGFLFAITLLATFKQLKTKRRDKDVFVLLPLYFFGFILLTFINKGVVQAQQFLPVLAITNLWFAFVIANSNKKLIWVLLIVIIILNFRQANIYLSDQEKNFLGKAPGSWVFLNKLGKEIAAKENGEFGYFVYSPDIFAYTPQYAMKQVFKATGAQAYDFEKKAVTYVIAGPPAKDRPGLSYDWWRKNKVNINAEPTEVINKPNEYMVERFELTDEEQEQPWEHLINVGIHFR